LDLQYNLPVQVRDAALAKAATAAPVSNVMRDYNAAQRALKSAEEGAVAHCVVAKPNAMLQRLRRTGPYYARNRPHICSFFVKGICNRGSDCPYRHEKPEDKGPLADQNIKDRYFGNKDPVAEKLLKRHESMKSSEGRFRSAPPPPPQDPNVRTLWIGGINSEFQDTHLRDVFAPFGPIASIRMVGEKFCAFVTFVNRGDAENALQSLFNDLYVNGVKLRVLWGKGRISRGKKTAPSRPPGMTRKKVTGPRQMPVPVPIQAQVPINRNPLGNQRYSAMSNQYGAARFNPM